MNETTEKVIPTTLDRLPYGNYTAESITKKMSKPEIPEGVTRGMLMKDAFVIAWPSLVELILTQLTSMADQMMVGRLPGEAGVMALSAIGLAAQPKFLLMTMIQALNVGSTAVIARFRGQQNRTKANQVFKQAILLNMILSVILTLFGIVFCEPLIRFTSGSGVGEATLAQAVTYLEIQLYGFIPLVLTFTMTAALRGIGDSRTSMIYNTVANMVNLFFNYTMIYGKLGFPAMGVAGASLATVIGQTAAFFIAIGVILSKRRYVYLDFKEKFTFDKALMGNVITIGVPSMIEQLFMRAGMIIFTRSVSGLGTMMYATHQVCMNIMSMSFMMGQAFANATTTLMGQSLGKRRYDMAVLYMKQTRFLGMCASLVMAALFIAFGETIVGLYNTTPEVVATGGKILMIIAVAQPIQSTQFIVAGGLRGAGDTRYTAVVTAITVFGLRSGLAVLLITIMNLGIWGAWIAIICDQCVRSVLVLHRYNSGKWAKMALSNAAEKHAEA